MTRIKTALALAFALGVAAVANATTLKPMLTTYASSILATATQPADEPQTYAMLLAGLGLMGTVARRRNR